MTPRDFLRAGFRRRGMFLVTAALTTIVVLSGANLLEPQYTGSLTFERRKGMAAEFERNSSSESFQSHRVTLRTDLSGPAAIEKLIDQLNLDAGPDYERTSAGELTREGQAARRDLVERIMDDLAVRWDASSPSVELVSISFTHADPALAAEVPNRLYMNYERQSGEATLRRLEEDLAYYEKSLGEAEAELSAWQSKRVELLTNNAEYMLDRPGGLRTRLLSLERREQALQTELKQVGRVVADVDSRLTSVQARLEELRRVLSGEVVEDQLAVEATSAPASQPTTRPSRRVWGANPERQRLREQIQEYEVFLDNLIVLQSMKPEHPEVQKVKGKLRLLREQLEREPEMVQTEVAYDDNARRTQLAVDASFLDTQIAGLLAERASNRIAAEALQEQLRKVQGEMERYQALIDGLPSRQQAFADVEAEIVRASTEVERWRQQRDVVQMQLRGELKGHRTRLRPIQMAQELLRPSSPDLKIVLAGSMVAGLAAAAGLLFLLDHLDRTIVTVDDAAALGIPLHGVIGEIRSRGARRRKILKNWVLVPILTTLLVLGIAVSGFSVCLRLRYPRKYQQWVESPAAFVVNTVKVELARRQHPRPD